MNAVCPVCQRRTFKRRVTTHWVCAQCQAPLPTNRRPKTMTDKQREAYARLHAAGHFHRAGKIGGQKTKQRQTDGNPNYYSQIGQLGGRQLVSIRGHRWMGRLGSTSARIRGYATDDE